MNSDLWKPAQKNNQSQKKRFLGQTLDRGGGECTHSQQTNSFIDGGYHASLA